MAIIEKICTYITILLKKTPKQQQPQPHFQLPTEDLDCAETTIQQNLSALQTKLKVRNVCTNSKMFFYHLDVEISPVKVSVLP